MSCCIAVPSGLENSISNNMENVTADYVTRDSSPQLMTKRARVASEKRVEIGGRSLVVIDAVQTKAKRLHGGIADVLVFLRE